jgi:hypothetical protein
VYSFALRVCYNNSNSYNGGMVESPMKFRARLIGCSLILSILAACSNTNALPTVAELPTNAPDAATATGNTVAERATLPPTWTLEASATATHTPPASGTPSVTPSATITDTPSPSPTDLPTIPPDERARTSLLEDLLAAATGLPPQGFVASPAPIFTSAAPLGTPATLQAGQPSVVVLATSNSSIAVVPTLPATTSSTTVCPYLPPGGFGRIFTSNPDVAALLGCTTGSPPDVISSPGASQTFQQGNILWINGRIYVLKSDGTFRYYPDTYIAGTDPEFGSEVPPSGFFSPLRGMLKVWSQNPDVRSSVGWGTTDELGAQATTLAFQRGLMIWMPVRSDIIVLISNDALLTGTWRSFAGAF